MTPIEAFEFTMKKISELKESGIKVNIKPYKFINDKDREEMIAEYGGQVCRVPYDKWVSVSFENLSEEQNIKVSETLRYLGLCGISFDMGGCCGSRDWELDWSFTYNKGKEKWEWIDGIEEVEDMINDLSKEDKLDDGLEDEGSDG